MLVFFYWQQNKADRGEIVVEGLEGFGYTYWISSVDKSPVVMKQVPQSYHPYNFYSSDDDNGTLDSRHAYFDDVSLYES